MQKIYGYARVSTRDQNEARQTIALKEFGVAEKNLFIDNQSGKNFERPEYQRLGTRKEKDLIGTFIADLVLQIMSYFAQTERDLSKQRQAEGIATAKARGVKFGRKPLELPPNFGEVYKNWCEGKISARGAAKLLGTNHNTFLRWTKRFSN